MQQMCRRFPVSNVYPLREPFGISEQLKNSLELGEILLDIYSAIAYNRVIRNAIETKDGYEQ